MPTFLLRPFWFITPKYSGGLPVYRRFMLGSGDSGLKSYDVLKIVELDENDVPKVPYLGHNDDLFPR